MVNTDHSVLVRLMDLLMSHSYSTYILVLLMMCFACYSLSYLFCGPVLLLPDEHIRDDRTDIVLVHFLLSCHKGLRFHLCKVHVPITNWFYN